jgi:hypothetical protein
VSAGREAGTVLLFVGRWLTNNDDNFKFAGRNFAQHSDCTRGKGFGSIVACYIGFSIGYTYVRGDASTWRILC